MEVECPHARLSQAHFRGSARLFRGASLPSVLTVSRSALWGVWREKLSSPACHFGCTGQRADGVRVLFWALPPPAHPRPDLEVRCAAGEGMQEVATLPREGREHLSNPTLAGWGALGDAGCVSQVYPALTGPQRRETPAHSFLRELPSEASHIFQVACPSPPRWLWAQLGWPGSEGRRKGPATWLHTHWGYWDPRFLE